MNKLKILPIAMFCFISTLLGDAQCMDRFEQIEKQITLLNVRLSEIDQQMSFMNSIVPIGTIIEYSGNNSPPNNWLECNGQIVSRMNYPELLREIGVTYGMGDGLNTFNIPDRRGYVAVGVGTDPNTLAPNTSGNRITNATTPIISLGRTFGEETNLLTINEIPNHTHGIVCAPQTCLGGIYPGDIIVKSLNPPHSVPHNTDNTGGGNPHNNTQPSIFMKFYIRAK